MKTLTYLGPRNMELQDAPEPEPAAGEVRVRISATAICGSDLHGFREASPRRIPPLVMGHEVVGTVDAAGEGVAGELIGPPRRRHAGRLVRDVRPVRRAGGRTSVPNRVLMGMNFPGGFAEACTIPATHVLPVPAGLSDEVASLTEPFANSIHSVDRAVRPDATVLVIGAGPIGLFAATAAILAGAARTFVVDTMQHRLELAAKLGAEPVAADGAADELEQRDQRPRRRRGHRRRRLSGDVAARAAGGAARRPRRRDRPGRAGGPAQLPQRGRQGHHASSGPTRACRPTSTARCPCCPRASRTSSPWITTMPLSAGAAAFEALVDGTELTKVVLVP